mgnify:CR=1 FL=1|jgi:hypothetical protein
MSNSSVGSFSVEVVLNHLIKDFFTKEEIVRFKKLNAKAIVTESDISMALKSKQERKNESERVAKLITLVSSSLKKKSNTFTLHDDIQPFLLKVCPEWEFSDKHKFSTIGDKKQLLEALGEVRDSCEKASKEVNNFLRDLRRNKNPDSFMSHLMTIISTYIRDVNDQSSGKSPRSMTSDEKRHLADLVEEGYNTMLRTSHQCKGVGYEQHRSWNILDRIMKAISTSVLSSSGVTVRLPCVASLFTEKVVSQQATNVRKSRKKTGVSVVSIRGCTFACHVGGVYTFVTPENEEVQVSVSNPKHISKLRGDTTFHRAKIERLNDEWVLVSLHRMDHGKIKSTRKAYRSSEKFLPANGDMNFSDDESDEEDESGSHDQEEFEERVRLALEGNAGNLDHKGQPDLPEHQKALNGLFQNETEEQGEKLSKHDRFLKEREERLEQPGQRPGGSKGKKRVKTVSRFTD